jgi:DNA-binding transcriptional regulator GbsR (MarR family)
MLVAIPNSFFGRVNMMKTFTVNDDAYKYIAQLEVENERLQRKVDSLENVCRMLNYKNEQAEKDKTLADAMRTLIKEWKNYDC